MIQLSADRSHTRGWSLRGRAAAVVAAVVLLASAGVGCSGDDDKANKGDGPGSTAMPELTPAPSELEEELAATIDGAKACDWLDESECMFPFPSSRFENDDPKTDTKRKLEFELGALPVNVDGVEVEPKAWARLDGWGVGTPIMTTIAGVDPEASSFPTEADPASSLEKGSGTVIVDMTTGKRVAHWSEVDARPEIAEADRTTVLLHPLTMLEPGHRYAVGIAQPVDRGGEPDSGVQRVPRHPRPASDRDRTGGATAIPPRPGRQRRGRSGPAPLRAVADLGFHHHEREAAHRGPRLHA